MEGSQPSNPSQKQGKRKAKQNDAPKNRPLQGSKLRGLDKDPVEVRISKTLSWLLRHAAQGEGLAVRKDGYMKVAEILEHPKLKAQSLNLDMLKKIVQEDSKQRYDLIVESPEGKKLEVVLEATETPFDSSVNVPASSSTVIQTQADGIWLIKARQGHSMKEVELELRPITSVSDIPTQLAIHGTNWVAWRQIAKGGLSKMRRNHIHLAQNLAGQNVVSGMRSSSQVLIYIDVQKALDTGIKFWLSDNGVVLSEGDERGFLPTSVFDKVVDGQGEILKGWGSHI